MNDKEYRNRFALFLKENGWVKGDGHWGSWSHFIDLENEFNRLIETELSENVSVH